MHPVCRTCLRGIGDDNRLYLTEDSESLRVKTELSVCVPEIVIDIVINPVVCFNCVQALHSAYEFKAQCLQTEERINNYMKKANLDTNCDVPVQKLIASSVQSCIKSENKTCINSCSNPSTSDIIDDLNNLLDEALQTAPKYCEIFGDTNKREWEDDVFDHYVTELYEKTESDEEPKSINLKSITSKECFVRCVKLPDSLINSKLEIMPLTENKSKTDINKKLPKGQSGKKQYACNKCLYKSAYRHNLKRHISTVHNNENLLKPPFKLNKQYNRVGRLLKFSNKDKSKVHKNTGTGDKPFECNICNYRSAFKGNVKQHMTTHSDEKPFACKMCLFKSAYNYHLKRHISAVHNNENLLKPFKLNNPYKSEYKYCVKEHISRNRSIK